MLRRDERRRAVLLRLRSDCWARHFFQDSLLIVGVSQPSGSLSSMRQSSFAAVDFEFSIFEFTKFVDNFSTDDVCCSGGGGDGGGGGN
jgi:hypothetical protein